MVLNYIKTEWNKLPWMIIFAVILIGPAVSLWIGFGVPTKAGEGLTPWQWYFSISIHKYSLFFLPIVTGIFAALLCRFEHLSGGWKRLFTFPVPRSFIYLSKWIVLILLLLLTQIVFLAGFITIGTFKGLEGLIPWDLFVKSLLSGLAAAFPLGTLLLGVSLFWKSFATPFVLNMLFTVPSIIATGSPRLGIWYPWAQPFLAMMPENHQWAASVDPLVLTVAVMLYISVFAFSTLYWLAKTDW
ncbi:ABC transporter permease [Paenactinomyces guangxiensis]|uniref:ABC transporter permease n=1 Tax=Paenactinomyces guangxiensis TaxID=1490290 RepID=A0A7W1WSU3_9BACL|nr:ABC transporter permease [Paenactinomyces guangxiensis]MBA4495405.1 ABC transporter permease [Paenactinomyces guangxiensis]MBH8592474.1 ABC transporter permease [Paenactinomyces guangxiensis]